jgi:EAL and modified HD-GYP domain-containing signal transduction protein
MLVGTRQIVSWVGMMSLSGLNNKPSELTRAAMVRARTCERLAGCLDRTDVQRFYIVGLFSVIEALLDIPARQAVGSLPLNAEVVDAITSGGGIMGEVLRGVIEYEAGNWDRAHIIGVEDQTLSDAFHLAVLETDRAWAQISG